MNTNTNGFEIGDQVELINEPGVKGVIVGLVMCSVICDDMLENEEDTVFAHVRILEDPEFGSVDDVNNTSVLNLKLVTKFEE